MIKIYKLIYNGEIIYVGKTKQKYLSSRKSIGYKWNKQLHNLSKESKIELIEETIDILRERYWIERLRSEGCILLNKQKGSGFDNKEYHKEYGKEYRKENIYKIKEYRENNKEYMKEYMKEYYKNNKDKKEKRKLSQTKQAIYIREYRQRKKLEKI